MKYRILIFAIFLGAVVVLGIYPGSTLAQNKFIVLCYHSIPETPRPGDPYSLPRHTFVEQIEYLRTHGYRFVSVEDIIRASKGQKELPDKAVLLSFDDAYRSYYEFVFPFLRMMGYPSMLAVVGSWIDKPPKDIPEPLMSWNQIKEVATSGLVEIASHTFDLHKALPYTPQGNVGPAIGVRIFNREKGKYEVLNEYKRRLCLDFDKQDTLFRRKLGVRPRALVWPYGEYNHIAVSTAIEHGFTLCFTLEEGPASLRNLSAINRNMVLVGSIKEFIKQVTCPVEQEPIRAAQVDLDLIYDPASARQTDANLGRLIDRLVAMKVNTVFLQAFADPDGSGNIKSVYFANRVLPVRADIFGHAVHQMIIRGMDVYAWMPTLAIVLPDHELNRKLAVMASDREGRVRQSTSWYRRLTPFGPQVQKAVKMLYEDLASHTQIDGILFQDDAYLSENEDFNPLALEAYKQALGRPIGLADVKRDPALMERWTRYKTERLIKFTNALEDAVRAFRPNARFARNLYAPVLADETSEERFAQNYGLFLENYDWVVVMAYPQMEQAGQKWLKKIVQRSRSWPEGIKKTIFKVQAYDWSKKKWIPENTLLSEIREILASGGRHLAYYPDNCFEDRPRLKKIRLEFSTKVFPFLSEDAVGF